MKKALIIFGVILAAGAIAGGWIIWNSNKANSENKATGKNQLTTLPTSPAKASPTPSPEISQTGEMFITIATPVEGQAINTATIVVKGRTNPNADVGVNDKDTTANGNGDFSTTIDLSLGENEITAIATNENGDFAEKTVTVSREQ